MTQNQIIVSPQKGLQKNEALVDIRQMISACIQCGTCTASCPNEFAMDLTPRHLWRMVLMGQSDDIFKSKTFFLCSACYYCTLRCPRGLPLTDAMMALKQIAANRYPKEYKSSVAFYQSFIKSIRKNGRVHEVGFINHYYLLMGNPFLPLKYASLGLKLMRKGKLSLRAPKAKQGIQNLEAIFRKVESMEADL
jgi:heterodisulfide reductase subunit C